MSEEEKDLLKNYQLLTCKPVIYVANMSEEDIAHPEQSAYYNAVKAFAEEENNEVVAITAHLEEELSEMDREEKQLFLNDLGLEKSGLDGLIVKAYELLNLRTFLTVGTDEVRAWTFRKGMHANECAGIIHTDFMKGFIRAEVYSYDDIMEYGSEQALKEAGKLRIEGKDYEVQDGDIMHIRFNV